MSAAVASLLIFAALPAVSQSTRRESRPSREPNAAAAKADPMQARNLPDAAIAAALKDVSAAQIQATIEKLVSFGNRSTLSAADAEAVAAGKGVGAAREWIKAEFERYSNACGGCLDVRVDDFIEQPNRRIAKPTQLINVYAVLKGTDPESAKRIYVVSGHYDSRNSDNFNVTDPAPGANDDGSGTAVSLECARVLSKHKFPATIIFLTVPGEEQGLNGSKHFAQMAKTQGWNINAMLNNDIVGGNKSPEQDTSVVRVFSEGIPVTATEAEIKLIRSIGAENDSTSRQVARYVNEVGKKYAGNLGNFGPMMIFRPDRYLRGGDHSSFNEAGYAAVRFSEFREDYNRQHQTPRTENGVEFGDFAKFVDFDYVANVARLNAATLASLASAPAPPANVKLLTKQLENNSQLTWDAPVAGTPSGTSYEVLWRATTAPDWEHSRAVGNATRVTMEMSKDNVIFAVRAVDDKGHASLAVTPSPER
ncbi:MAG: peptidase [Acidobacteriales bacterium]|nr:peptidase [Terriglobales bacterium]